MRVLYVALTLALAGFGASFVQSASNESIGADPNRPDFIDALRGAGMVTYCGELAERWDDGTWSRAMGIADVIKAPEPGKPHSWANPDDIPRDYVRHQSWDRMNANEQAWYAMHFHAGWKTADQWISAHPLELNPEKHDFTGLIPFMERMILKQHRFEACLQDWQTEQKT